MDSENLGFVPDAPLSQLEKSLDLLGRYLLLFYLVFTVVLGIVLRNRGMIADFSDYFRLNGFDPMNASGLAALYVAFLSCRPSRNAIQVSLVLGLIAEVFYQLLVLPPEAGMASRLLTVGGGTGVVGFFCILGTYLGGAKPIHRARARAFLLAGLCLLLYPIAAGKGIGLLSEATHTVFDSHLYRFEGSLGFFPSQEVAKLLLSSYALHFLVLAVYSRLPLFIFLGIYLSVRYERFCYTNVLKAFILGGVLAFPFFFVLPMVGIDLFVGTPPWPLLELPAINEFKPVEAPLSYPRTCLPSLHTTWVLTVYFAVAGISRRTAVFAGVVVFLTLISALGPSVGHYIVDLLVGVPFCLGVVACASPKNAGNAVWRTYCMAFGFGSTAFWVVAFRFFPDAVLSLHWLAWTAMLLACGATFWLEASLARSSVSLVDESEANAA